MNPVWMDRSACILNSSIQVASYLLSARTPEGQLPYMMWHLWIWTSSNLHPWSDWKVMWSSLDVIHWFKYFEYISVPEWDSCGVFNRYPNFISFYSSKFLLQLAIVQTVVCNASNHFTPLHISASAAVAVTLWNTRAIAESCVSWHSTCHTLSHKINHPLRLHI